MMAAVSATLNGHVINRQSDAEKDHDHDSWEYVMPNGREVRWISIYWEGKHGF